MNRSTTREEYKLFMQKWRAVLTNSVSPGDSYRWERAVRDESRSIVWNAIYNVVPEEFWHMTARFGREQPIKPSHSYKAFARFNLNHCANSWPHKTRNPV